MGLRERTRVLGYVLQDQHWGQCKLLNEQELGTIPIPSVWRERGEGGGSRGLEFRAGAPMRDSYG